MGLPLLLGGAVFDAPHLRLGDFGGLVAGFALLVVAWAVVEIVASIGMFGWRRWGPRRRLIVGIVGLALTGPALLTPGSRGDDGWRPSLASTSPSRRVRLTLHPWRGRPPLRPR